MAELGLELGSPEPAGLRPAAHIGVTVRLPASSSRCQAVGARGELAGPWRMSLGNAGTSLLASVWFSFPPKRRSVSPSPLPPP